MAHAVAEPLTRDRPNIVVIIADDLGYGETGMMGNEEIPAPEPFCLVVSYNAVHRAMQARDEDLEVLHRIKDVQRRIFAGMLLALDRGVGRVHDALLEEGLKRKTMVVLLSVNGGPTKELTSSNAPLKSGNWKIVRPKQNAAIELYHLLSDPGEERNLVRQHPIN